MRPGELAKTLEPTLLRPNALVSEIDELCALAEREHVACVVVFPVWVSYARARLDGSDVRVCAAIAHPYGGESEAAKAAAAAEAVRDGAHDVEVVASLPALANGDFQAVRDELAHVARAARGVRGGALVRAVLETCYLEDRALRLAGRVVASAGVDGATTSTGVGPEGATEHVVRVLREELPAGCMVKATGGIGSVEDARLMIEAGASRLGTTVAGRLLDELRASR
ncbi:MAG: deoxyribose-phosphate aldolase [Gaiellales bacterium]|nr:deoxyribose-phosphate aldolase [Gaiellales bacterium]